MARITSIFDTAKAPSEAKIEQPNITELGNERELGGIKPPPIPTFEVPQVSFPGFSEAPGTELTPQETQHSEAIYNDVSAVDFVNQTTVRPDGTEVQASVPIASTQSDAPTTLEIPNMEIAELQKKFNPNKALEKEGFKYLVGKLKADPNLTQHQKAYILATATWETGHTMRPIDEWGKGKKHSYGKADPVSGQAYYGRGYVQLTWKANYEKMSKVFGLDLVNNPSHVKQKELAYKIMVHGMVNGSFTGKKLSSYISKNKVDYVNARRTVNGTDKANTIANYAKKMEALFD